MLFILTLQRLLELQTSKEKKKQEVNHRERAVKQATEQKMKS